MASPGEGPGEPLATLSFDSFWGWVTQHPNCLFRVGTADAVIYDDEDLHWQFYSEPPHLLVQVVRGKRLMGEVALDPERVSYVQAMGEEREGEFLFELISETETERIAAYFFVMSHGFEDEEPTHGRAIH